MIRRNITLLFLVLFTCLGFSFAAIKLTGASPIAKVAKLGNEIIKKPINVVKEGAKSTIQVALLLDTSGSMEGLIEQAKSQLWNILNELARTQKNDQETNLQIALYEYGNPRTGDTELQIRQLSGFTTDMDLISELLFSLQTDGGQEYCGAVLKRSLDELKWKAGDGLKMIYIAGNEPFTQGPINYLQVCERAQTEGIVINTIFCGDLKDGKFGQWDDGAVIAGGEFINISHNEETVYIASPYDDEINKLNKKLNDTYIPYGKYGTSKKENQRRQDMNAISYSKSNAADRISYKSSSKYKADDWDLVDAYKKDKSILKTADIKSEKYSTMSIEELEAKVEEITTQRSTIKAEIKKLDKKRRVYKEKEAQKSLSDKDKSLQNSIIKSVRKQASKKGFKIKDE
ncbi:MAG: vWA domain-containing protein [Bacteroidota bacterium]